MISKARIRRLIFGSIRVFQIVFLQRDKVTNLKSLLLSPINSVDYRRANFEKELLELENAFEECNKISRPIKFKASDFQRLPYFKIENTMTEETIAKSFDQYGSDKRGSGYHQIYQPILSLISNKQKPVILEIGIGTNYLDIESNMGPFGVPGASLLAWQNLIPRAKIIGADIDDRIFKNQNLQGFDLYHVDQLDKNSLEILARKLPDLDLVVDDGLHTPLSNLQTFQALFSKLKRGGIYVIEDISEKASYTTIFWKFIHDMNDLGHESWFVQTEHSNVVIVIK